jgi:glycosyltransferase involved in cell wall biosynthesis
MRAMWIKLQESIVREASLITVTTPGTAKFYRETCPDFPSHHVEIIENGFDPDIFPEMPLKPESRPPVVLLHSGILYPRERDPLPFFRALKRLLSTGKITRGSIRVRLRASGFESEYASILSKLALDDVVELAPPLPYTEALREMQSVDALLVLQAKVCDEQIPAKAYEYLYAGRPIIGLANPTGDTGKLLQRFNVPCLAALEDEDEIVATLEAALPRIESGTYEVPARDRVMQLSRRAGAERLANLLTGLV